uniref:Uncharacterized protein n=1 Tax=Cannabis sativa TaxID=3483 RepID=A0A803PCV7_CANSA
MGLSDSVTEALNDSNFWVIEGNCDVGRDGLDFDLGLGIDIDLGMDRHCLDVDGDDDFFVTRRVFGLESGEALSSSVREGEALSSSVREADAFDTCIRLVGNGSESDEENIGVIGIDIQSEEAYDLDHTHEENDDDTGLCVLLFHPSIKIMVDPALSALFEDSVQVSTKDITCDLHPKEVDLLKEPNRVLLGKLVCHTRLGKKAIQGSLNNAWSSISGWSWKECDDGLPQFSF